MADDLQNNKDRNNLKPEFMPVLILDEDGNNKNSNTSSYKTNTNSSSTESENSTKKYESEQGTTQTLDANKNISQEQKKPLPKKNSLEIINVVRSYDWTYSRDKIRKIDEIPYITLKEFKIAANSYVSSLMTSALLFPDVLTGDVNAAKGMYKTLETAFQNNALGKFMKNISSGVAGATDMVNEKFPDLSEMSKKASQWKKDQILDQSANEWGANKQDLIDNYSLLYLRQPTERTYVFPYFDNSFIKIQNNFSDSYEAQTPTQQSLANVNDLIRNSAKYLDVGSAAEPGMYIQRPQFYQFSDSGYEIDVNFFLFNTITANSYASNLSLITKLLIQNTPHRFNRILVDPPCIYELTVPGRGFYPYTYIKEFSVVHHGTKRMMNLGGKKVIIPDAFEVKLRISSLTSEVNNFMIPETGSAGIDVSKRYKMDYSKFIGDISDSIGKMVDSVVSKPTETPAKKQDPVEQAQTRQAQQVDTPQKATKLANEQKNYQAAAWMGMGGR